MTNRLCTISFVAIFALTGCIIDTKHTQSNLNKPLVENRPHLSRPSPKSYLRPVSRKEFLETTKITYSKPSAPLLEILTSTLPNYNIIPGDPSAEMTTPLAVSVKDLSLSQFLTYLEGLTGYDLALKKNTITVSARMTKQWNLSALASLRKYKTKVGQTISGITKGAEGKGDTSSTTTQFDNSADFDQWDLLLKSARTIVGASEKENTPALSDEVLGENAVTPFGIPAAYSASTPPFVAGNRPMGILLASGEPRRVKILDQYIQNLERTSSVQVNIDMKAFDVTLHDSRGAGIDWTALRENTKLGFNILAPVLGVVPTADTTKGLWSGVFKYTKTPNTVTAAIRFLEDYGKVQLINDPNLTVLNGTTAYLSSGDEFSFISDIESRQDGSNNANIVTTPKFSRIRVGVTMSVTPRLLEGDRILLDIVPVVSSLQGFDTIKVAGDSEQKALKSIDTPRIALQELSTQVIARSGETVQLGGLITRKIEEALTRVPLKSNVLTKLFDLLFKSNTNKLERRELVLLVTPTLTESAKWSP